MVQNVRFTGNSRKYGIEVNGERVNFGKIELDNSVLDIVTEVTLSGGNLSVKLPDGVEWSVDVTDGVARLSLN